MLGIYVPTYNRRGLLEKTVEAIRRHTKNDFLLVVSDDGSSDKTTAWLARQQDIVALTGHGHGGMAWNINHALWWLMNRTDCDVLMQVEDDVQPCLDDWTESWERAARRWGCVQYLGFTLPSKAGLGIPSDPFWARTLGAQVMAMTRNGVEKVGYFDTAWYGRDWSWAHLEWAARFGPHFGWPHGPIDFPCLRRGVIAEDTPTAGQARDVAASAGLFDTLTAGRRIGLPWRDDAEQSTFETMIGSEGSSR